jgi:ribose 5-phosphate isomerase A
VIGNGDGTVEVRNINDGTVEREKIEILEGDNLFNLS